MGQAAMILGVRARKKERRRAVWERNKACFGQRKKRCSWKEPLFHWKNDKTLKGNGFQSVVPKVFHLIRLLKTSFRQLISFYSFAMFYKVENRSRATILYNMSQEIAHVLLENVMIQKKNVTRSEISHLKKKY